MKRAGIVLGILISSAAGCGDGGEDTAPAARGGSGGSGGDPGAGEAGMTGDAGEASVGGSGGETSSGGSGGEATAPPQPWDPALLEWEALPSLAEGDEFSAGEAKVATSKSGDIFVSAGFSTGVFSAPWSLRVFQLVDGEWELLGGAPALDGANSVGNRALAVAGNGDVYASFSAGGALLYRFDGSEWSEVTVDAAANDLTIGLITSDASGRIVALGHTEGDVVAYRLEGEDWTRVGGAVTASSSAPGFMSGLASSSNDELAVAHDGNLLRLEGDEWSDLGLFHDAGAVLPSWPTLAFEPNGDLILSWREDTDAGTTLFASRWASGAAEPEHLSEIGFESAQPPSYSQLAVNGAGQIFATWRQHSVFVAHHVDGEWQPFIGDGDVAAHTSGGTLPDIALSPEGLPIVVWEAAVDGDPLVGVSRAVVK
jgi:hypothetical protein